MFCDDCNTPYHQLCHVPIIDRIVVEVADAQWFCKECRGKRREIPLETGLSGENLSLDIKQIYLSSLSRAQLIELLRFAETVDPKIPIYSPQTHSIALRMQLENSSRPFPSNGGNGQVDYEDLLVDALIAKAGAGEGVHLDQIWAWIAADTQSPGTVDSQFKQVATRALQRALRKGRIIKRQRLYYVNSHYHAPSDVTLGQYLAADDEALFGEIPMRIPETSPEDLDFCVDDNDEAFSHRVYVEA